MSVLVNKDTKVSESFLHANMFGQIMLFPVRKLDEDGKEVPIEASDFEARSSEMIEELNHAIPQENTSDHAGEPSLRCLASVDKIEDGEEWQSVLGKNGRIWLYRTEKSHDEYDYSLLVHVDQTQASLDLLRKHRVHSNAVLYSSILGSLLDQSLTHLLFLEKSSVFTIRFAPGRGILP